MEQEELTGQATPEKIAQWKQKHGDIFAVEVENSICYLHKPDRKTMKAVASIGQADPIRASEILLENCWIDGDPDIKTDDEKFFAVSKEMAKIIEVKQAELKKL